MSNELELRNTKRPNCPHPFLTPSLSIQYHYFSPPYHSPSPFFNPLSLNQTFRLSHTPTHTHTLSQRSISLTPSLSLGRRNPSNLLVAGIPPTSWSPESLLAHRLRLPVEPPVSRRLCSSPAAVSRSSPTDVSLSLSRRRPLLVAGFSSQVPFSLFFSVNFSLWRWWPVVSTAVVAGGVRW